MGNVGSRHTAENVGHMIMCVRRNSGGMKYNIFHRECKTALWVIFLNLEQGGSYKAAILVSRLHRRICEMSD
jgi:hypothetical protein